MSITVPGRPAEDLGPATEPLPVESGLLGLVSDLVDQHSRELTYMRRWLHSRPEMSRAEHQTTAILKERLLVEGLQPRVLAVGTGLACDIGETGPIVALRADIDALAMQDAKDVPYRSRHDGACHACGHDVHTSIVLGAGLVIRQLAASGRLRGRIRLIFEPAEEAIPGGALDVIDEGWLDGVGGIFGVHCDPRLDAGRIGCRIGAITSASDVVAVRMSGPGGHTARPGLSVNLADQAALLVRELPAALEALAGGHGPTRLVFGTLHAGTAANVIPSEAHLSGSLRTPSPTAWDALGPAVPRAIANVLGTDLRPEVNGYQGSRPDGLHWHLEHRQGVPPVINDAEATRIVARAAHAANGPDAAVDTPHSWGGDTFGWYLHHVPGSFARLGTHWPGRPDQVDLHRPEFDVDEGAIPFGTRVLVLAALAWMARLR